MSKEFFKAMVQDEVDYYLLKCNFDEREREVFLSRSKNIPLEEIAENMNVSVSTVKRINGTMKNKIKKIVSM